MKYIVTTESAVYSIDREDGWIVRNPLSDPSPGAVAEALRRDGERIKLLDMGPIKVGEPMTLALSIVEGITTVRRTTLVIRAEEVDKRPATP